MNPTDLEPIINHDGRLDVLCCLIDGERLTVSQLSARTGKSLAAVKQYVKLLESFDLVEKAPTVAGTEQLYGIDLQGHPDWVRTAIQDHRCS